MKSFEYKNAQTLEEAQIAASPDWNITQYYAGGTDQLSLLKHDIISPERLINLKKIQGLDDIVLNKKEVKIGSTVTLSDIIKHASLNKRFPVLARAASLVASPQLRNMATIAGNLCQRPRCWYYRGDFNCLRKGGDICYSVGGENKYHCIIGGDPCFIIHPSDMAVCLTALDASVVIYEKKKEQLVALDNFYVLPEDDLLRENILKPHQIIKSIQIPNPEKETVTYFEKVRERQSWDFAIVSVALSLKVKNKKVIKGKLVLGGVAPKPWTDSRWNEALKDMDLNSRSIDSFVQNILADADVMDQNEYKIQMTRNLVKHMLSSAG